MATTQSACHDMARREIALRLPLLSDSDQDALARLIVGLAEPSEVGWLRRNTLRQRDPDEVDNFIRAHIQVAAAIQEERPWNLQADIRRLVPGLAEQGVAEVAAQIRRRIASAVSAQLAEAERVPAGGLFGCVDVMTESFAPQQLAGLMLRKLGRLSVHLGTSNALLAWVDDDSELSCEAIDYPLVLLGATSVGADAIDCFLIEREQRASQTSKLTPGEVDRINHVLNQASETTLSALGGARSDLGGLDPWQRAQLASWKPAVATRSRRGLAGLAGLWITSVLLLAAVQVGAIVVAVSLNEHVYEIHGATRALPQTLDLLFSSLHSVGLITLAGVLLLASGWVGDAAYRSLTVRGRWGCRSLSALSASGGVITVSVLVSETQQDLTVLAARLSMPEYLIWGFAWAFTVLSMAVGAWLPELMWRNFERRVAGLRTAVGNERYAQLQQVTDLFDEAKQALNELARHASEEPEHVAQSVALLVELRRFAITGVDLLDRRLAEALFPGLVRTDLSAQKHCRGALD